MQTSTNALILLVKIELLVLTVLGLLLATVSKDIKVTCVRVILTNVAILLVKTTQLVSILSDLSHVNAQMGMKVICVRLIVIIHPV